MFDRKIIDEIKESKGYSIALFTTFNFEINYFERAILNTLYGNDIRKIELFIDSSELEKSIQENNENHLNKKYLVMPINIQSAFHPKIILLLGKEKAKLIVSSANIKTSGYTLNNEIYNVFSFDKNYQENLNLINNAVDFFNKLNEMAYYKDDSIFKEISEYIYIKKKNEINETILIQNLEDNVIKQVRKIINDTVKSIDIAVPYYDNELKGLKELKEQFKCTNINVYLQNGKSTFPLDYNLKNHVVNQKNIMPFVFLKNNNKNNFYHAKVFRFNTKDKSYILYGSSNCTLSALSKTYKNGGNIECNILEYGTATEFEYYFNNFNIDYSQELMCNKIEEKRIIQKNYNFKYGLEDKTFKLYFSYNKKYENLKIYLGELNLMYQYEEDELIVNIPQNISNLISNIFDLHFKFENREEVIRCWYIDIETIESYREAEGKNNFDDISIDGDLDRYRENMKRIAKTLAFTKDEYSEHIEIIRTLNNNKNNENQEDLSEEEMNDEFIVDKEIPDEYIEKNRTLTNAYSKSKLFSRRFFEGLKIGRTYLSKSGENNNIENSESSKKTRRATSAEKRFERFVKNRIKGMLNEEYVKIIKYSHYKNAIGLMLDIINQYKYVENVKDMFDDKYVTEMSTESINNLLNKNGEDEDSESTIILTFVIILENYRISQLDKENSYKIEARNKQIINRLNKLYKIR